MQFVVLLFFIHWPQQKYKKVLFLFMNLLSLVYKSNFYWTAPIPTGFWTEAFGSPYFGSSTRQCRHVSWFQTKAQSKIRRVGALTSFTASVLTRPTIYKAATSLHLTAVTDVDWPVGSVFGYILCLSISLPISISVPTICTCTASLFPENTSD